MHYTLKLQHSYRYNHIIKQEIASKLAEMRNLQNLSEEEFRTSGIIPNNNEDHMI